MSPLNKTWFHQYSDYEEKTPISCKFKHHQRTWHPGLYSECGLKGYEENYMALGKIPTWIRPPLLATGPNPLSCSASKASPTELLLLTLSTAMLLEDSWTCQSQATATCLQTLPKSHPESEPTGAAQTTWLCSDCSGSSPS